MLKTIFLIILLLQLNEAKPKDNFLIIGHRGAAGYAPENTIPSIKYAIELGANAIEIDLRQTKDAIPIAIHDSDVDRTTDSCGTVSKFTLEEIKKFDAGSWFDGKFAGTKIPTLEEILQILPDSIILIIEFKGGLGKYNNIEKNTLRLIEKFNISDQMILKSFDPNQLEYLVSLVQNIRLLYVYAVRIPWLHIVVDTGISFISVYDLPTKYLQPHRFFLSSSFVNEAQDKGKKVIAWGVNDEDDIKNAINIGVNGIETDYPDRVFEIYNSK